jgi:hypothetical protein
LARVDQQIVRLERVTVRPRPASASWWTLLGAALVAAGVFLVLDTSGHPAAWAALALFVPVAAFFTAQLVAPGAVAVHLDAEGLVARAPWRRTRVRWDDVHLARVRRVAGDPVLVLEIRQPASDGPASQDVVGILLPVGADLQALHSFLEQRLGRGGRAARGPGSED